MIKCARTTYRRHYLRTVQPWHMISGYALMHHRHYLRCRGNYDPDFEQSIAWVLASLQVHLAWSAPTNILTKKIRNANVHQSYAAGVMKVGSKLDKKPYWYQVLFLLGEGAQQKDAFLTMVNWGFHMISDEDQLYARIVELDEI